VNCILAAQTSLAVADLTVSGATKTNAAFLHLLKSAFA
jgi:hypothetical protein